uniref:IS600 orfA n=1 Tax=Shigella flexneri serotype 5a (strain M90T) TaxID=1086030 RepID=Q9AFK0_SHIFM|nr:IS600 orfA, fragment [Shigella flexneri 5a str. M90T]
MSRKTRRYSKEFKAEAVRTVLENQLSISEDASRLFLPEGTLGGLAEFGKNRTLRFSGHP